MSIENNILEGLAEMHIEAPKLAERLLKSLNEKDYEEALTISGQLNFMLVAAFTVSELLKNK